jgi:diguanylate cyclase (GGDEF)-like protein
MKTDFMRILQERRLYSVYQPIVSLKNADILGYEALSRVDRGSLFQSPVTLFEFAEEQGYLLRLDRLAREKAIAGANLAQSCQKLFINISAAILLDSRFAPGWTMELLQESGLAPSNVVFELTERSSINDFELAKKVLEHYRSQGYQIAIDDAGAGYSSLQAIAELNPDYIKMDRSLIQGIHVNKTKEYIVETFVSFAQKLNVPIIAEGIEEQEELVKLTRMGVHYGQGYFLGRPDERLRQIHEEHASLILHHRKIQETVGSVWSIGDLLAPVKQLLVSSPISEAATYFKENSGSTAIAVVNDSVPVGLVMRERLFQQLAGQYGFSLFWNRPIDQIMDKNPLIVDEHTAVEQVSQLATSRTIQNLYDLVLITSRGKMAGAASIRAILECITNARMETAKVASPLTGLPGNIQIHRVLSKRLMEQKPFSVIYADLDYFKWYNDKYGFQKGDQMIQFTADIIQQSVMACGNPHDFVGHIGGDDFIALTTAAEPELICKEIVRRFEQGVEMFYDAVDWTYVEDRKGRRIESDGVSISVSMVICGPGTSITLELISQTAARLKKEAKLLSGSAYLAASIGF